MIAVIAFDPCKTLTEVSAVQIFIDVIHHVRTPINDRLRQSVGSDS